MCSKNAQDIIRNTLSHKNRKRSGGSGGGLKIHQPVQGGSQQLPTPVGATPAQLQMLDRLPLGGFLRRASAGRSLLGG